MNTTGQQTTSPITADSILELDKSEHSRNSAGVEDLLNQADHLLAHGKTLAADGSSTLNGLQYSSTTSLGTLNNSGKVEPIIVETTTPVAPIETTAAKKDAATEDEIIEDEEEVEVEVTDEAYEEEEILEEEEVEVSEGVYEEEIIDTEGEDNVAELAVIQEVPAVEEAANELAAKEAAAVALPASPVKSAAAVVSVSEPCSPIQISSQSLATGQMKTPPDSTASAEVIGKVDTAEPVHNDNDDNDPYKTLESSESSETVDTMDSSEELWKLAEAAEEAEATEQQAKSSPIDAPRKSAAVQSAPISTPKRTDDSLLSSSQPRSPVAMTGQSLASGMIDEAGEQVLQVEASEHSVNDDDKMPFGSSEHQKQAALQAPASPPTVSHTIHTLAPPEGAPSPVKYSKEKAALQAPASPPTISRATLAPPEGAPSPVKYSKEKVTEPVVAASNSNNKKRDINAKTSEEVKSPRRPQRNRVAAGVAGAIGAGLTAGAVTKFANNKGNGMAATASGAAAPPKVIHTPHYVDDPTDEATMDRLAENAVAMEASLSSMSAVPEEPAGDGAGKENSKESSEHTTGEEEAYAGPVDLDDVEEAQYSTASEDSQSSATVETNETGEDELWKQAEAETSDNEQENKDGVEQNDDDDDDESPTPVMAAAAVGGLGAAAGVGAGFVTAAHQPQDNPSISPNSDAYVQRAIAVQSAPPGTDESPKEPEIASRALPFNDQDVENGIQPQESPKDDEDLTKKTEEEDYAENRNSIFTPLVVCQLCVICLVIIAIAVLIPLLLLKKDDDRSIDLSDDTLRYKPSHGTFSGKPESDFGYSTSYDDGVLAVGAPQGNYVSTYALNNVGDLELVEDLLGEEAGSEFGTAVSVSNRALAVGAPKVLADGTPTEAGGAYVYLYGNAWSQLGDAIRGEEDVYAANELFGSSIGIANSFSGIRLAVGAPMNNVQALGAGRVYTYEFTDGEWTRVGETPILGERAGDNFGASLAMAEDGSAFVAGAPCYGNDDPGYILCYRYVGDDPKKPWELSFALGGESNSEEFGASVAMLTENGDTFAIGSPGTANGGGRVRVYKRRDETPFHEQIGPDIVGEEGDRIGLRNSLSGTRNGEKYSIVVATKHGTVKRYDYNSNADQWEEWYETLDAGFEGAISSLSITGPNSDFLAVASADDGEVSLFDATSLPEDFVPPSGTVAPTASPTAVSTDAATTISPTLSPTAEQTFDNLLEWATAGGPFTVNAPDSGYSSSVGISDSLMAVGAPFALNVGAVLTYVKGGDGSWTASQEVYNTETDSAFGYAIKVAGNSMLVGAPFTNNVGSASYYEQSGTEFSLVGSPLVGSSDISTPNELFGASVGLSSNRRAAIGAPANSFDDASGRGAVYIQEFVESDWTTQFSVNGLAAGDALGQTVDMDDSGTLVVAGAPGGETSYAMVFEKKGDTWENTFSVIADNPGELVGQSVRALSSGFFAVGAPGYDGGRGRIMVFEKVGNAFERLPDLVGEPGEGIGGIGKVSGSVSALLVATNNGVVKRFDFDPSTNKWTQIAVKVDTGLGSKLTSIAAGPGVMNFVAGGDLKATVYELQI